MSGSLEEQFLCSICLEVFSEPVSTPCGHNFCKRCISQHWDTNALCFCPLCKEVFSMRQELRTNTPLSGMVSQFKSEAELRSKKVSKPGDVQCDVCSEPKLKAVKSCLVCLSSFCESHLQPHLTVSGLKRHQLMEPVDDLEDRVCPTHQRPLELFCNTDQSCVCTMCVPLKHTKHELWSLDEACERRRSSLQKTVVQNQNKVEQRRLKVQKIRAALDQTQREADLETQQMVKVFSDIMESVQRCLDHHLEVMEQSLSKHKERAQALIQQLQQEMCELEKSSTEAQQLSLSTDPLHFLQRCPALPPAGLKDWSSVSFEPQTCEGSAARALSELETSLSQEFKKVFRQLPPKDQLRRRVQTFAVDVTLDPDSAHPRLVLSEDLKQVHHTDVKKKLPDSPQRFTNYAIILGKQSFSSGRFYFEVQVKGKTEWTLGVARESVDRKGDISASPKNGFWTIDLRNSTGQYRARTDSPVPLSPQRPPQKVGVFVDYGAGLVSFYDVDSADLLYSFTGCSFREKLFPFFEPCTNKRGTNSAPLIISAVEKDLEETDLRDQ